MGRHGLALAGLMLLGTAGCSGSDPASPADALSPACGSPAPLRGEFDPAAPGYIVEFHPSVDSEQETARLAALYAFEPRHVYTAAFNGFSARLTPDQVAQLRCEATVRAIEHDGTIQAQ